MAGPDHTASASVRGASITACPRGAHLMTWTARGVERLWMSPLSECGSRTALRGGVPVLFPQFGSFGDLPKHGFARTAQWHQVSPAADSRRADRAALAFELADTEVTRDRWPHQFTARLDISASADDLELVLSVSNPGEVPMQFTAGLHTYLLVSDPEASIGGLAGGLAWDGASTAAPQFTQALPEPIRALDARDVVVRGVPGSVVLRDGVRGTVTLSAEGFPDTVVWNPGAGHGLPDVVDGDEARFVCIEAVAVTPIVLRAAGTWVGSQHLALG